MQAWPRAFVRLAYAIDCGEMQAKLKHARTKGCRRLGTSTITTYTIVDVVSLVPTICISFLPHLNVRPVRCDWASAS
jgi:hypothetical protein